MRAEPVSRFKWKEWSLQKAKKPQMDPSGLRVTAAAGIRLSTQKVYKVDTLKRKLTGLVLPEVEFDIGNRSGRSKAAGSCREIL